MSASLYTVPINESDKNEYKILFTWDDEASVWIATSEDVYGLILEHESLDTLFSRVQLAVPELLAYENHIENDISLDFSINRKIKLS